MAQQEDAYLRECRRKGICPTCQNLITRAVGSGRIEDGSFCCLDCYTAWRGAEVVKRRQSQSTKDEG